MFYSLGRRLPPGPIRFALLHNVYSVECLRVLVGWVLDAVVRLLVACRAAGLNKAAQNGSVTRAQLLMPRTQQRLDCNLLHFVAE